MSIKKTKLLILGLMCITIMLSLSSCSTSSSPTSSSPESVLALEPTWPAVKTYTISQNSDDGTEANDTTWYENGYSNSCNYIGKTDDEPDTTYSVGLRFNLADINHGDSIEYARLRMPSKGGNITSTMKLLISGEDVDSPALFSNSRRPSQLTKTSALVNWDVSTSWIDSGIKLTHYYSSPDISSIINEIINRDNWGDSGKYIVLILEEKGSTADEDNYVEFQDYSDSGAITPAKLEIYSTVEDAFIGKEMLGRPTNSSIVINLISLLNMDVYAEYGTSPGNYTNSTSELLNQPAEQPIEITLNNLSADTTYYYRIRYRKSGQSTYSAGTERSFQTQRTEGSSFVFTITADEHLWKRIVDNDQDGLDLYEQTLANIANNSPDLHFSLGDFAHTHFMKGRHADDQQEAEERYLEQRKYFDKILHSIPFFLVLGNHEGEGRYPQPGLPPDDLEIWSTLARKKVIPNPLADSFYSGNQDNTACCGLREDYYSFEWGDALFVVLDPYWYTTDLNSRWDWTIGDTQYNWLYNVLHNSNTNWKFIFIHHLTGGVVTYGRGGIEAAKFKEAFYPSYEWGGEDENGNYILATKRPNWTHGAIHDMMIAEGVNIVFHGHDHVYVYQILDDIVYLECPHPSDSSYSQGCCYNTSKYQENDHSHAENNSGHIKVTINSGMVQVDYIRAVLPADEPLSENGTLLYNGDISYTYYLYK